MIIGHQSIINYLTKIIKNNKPTHAYLFYGPPHIGKTTTAKWFAQNLLCLDSNALKAEKKKSEACHRCQICSLINKNIYPDLYFIKRLPENKHITIQQIRDLQTRLSQTAFYNSYKVAIIKGAENLNNESANAFLKILEEPPKKTVFILTADNLHSLLPTILSRTEIIKFALIKEQEIITALGTRSNHNNEQKKFIARFVQGKIGEAFSLDGEKIKDIINKEKNILQIIKSSPDQKINLIKEIIPDEGKNKAFVYYTASLIRDALLQKVGLTKYITHHYLHKELQKMTSRYQLANLKSTLDSLIQLPEQLKHNLNQQLLWQNLFLKI